jgi:hypothetical protein
MRLVEKLDWKGLMKCPDVLFDTFRVNVTEYYPGGKKKALIILKQLGMFGT